MPIDLFTEKITIKRRTKTGINDLGEITYSEADVYTDQPARYEDVDNSRSGTFGYMHSGQRPDGNIRIYIPSNVICLEQDKVYRQTEYIGIILRILKAFDANGTTDHYELFIEKP